MCFSINTATKPPTYAGGSPNSPKKPADLRRRLAETSGDRQT
ncbi:MAG: hypothetical protein ACRCUY_12615 [Thermoguttaceae bacterium]